MPKPPEIDAAIGRGLAFLAKNQEADGSFISFSSPSVKPFRAVRSWQTTFVPALMMASLAAINTPAAMAIRKRLAGFLLDQKDSNWAFNYWAKAAPEQKTLPYPNDLDDTFCALAGLYLHDPDIIDEEALAKAIKLLLATETAVGGPYRTWLVADDSQPIWLDVDMAVNSNVAYFLSLVSNRLPKLDDLMGRAIMADEFSSPYYPSVYAFVYYFARAYGGPRQDQLLRKARRLHKAATTDLDRALCLSARIRLGDGQDLSASVQTLLAGQGRDGAWPAAVFYADPVKNGKLYYNGGAALTTAFALEALQFYSQAGRAAGPVAAGRDDKARPAVLALANRQCRHLSADLRASTLEPMKKLAFSSDGAEIVDLPFHFNDSLLRPVKSVPANFLETLGLANLYGWLAYTIYDDFLDEEGRPELLPAANLAMRNSVSCFSMALPANHSFRSLVSQVFDTIDSANAWELAHCRLGRQDGRLVIDELPDYGNLDKLAERSLGHTLAPLAVLSAKGLDAGDPACKQVRLALKHYLIARQLNDDAHDWPDDLKRGQATFVVTRILTDLGVKPGNYSLKSLVPDARRQFWHGSLPAICRRARRHVNLSRRAIKRSALLKPDNVISGLLDGLENSIQDTLAKQSQASGFLKHYRPKAVKP